MATTTYQGKATAKERSVSAHSLRSDPAYQAYTLLRIALTRGPCIRCPAGSGEAGPWRRAAVEMGPLPDSPFARFRRRWQ